MFLGIDLGTSSVKAILVDENERVRGAASAAIPISRPRRGVSEQDPEDWWRAAVSVLDSLRAEQSRALSAVRAIGLSGQMHGATLLGAEGEVLRPCILWNDVRSVQECRELEEAFPDLHAVTGNLAMPGFTAPKLLWVRRHEPDVFRRTEKVLLPKAYLRYRLTGEMADDMSDASGTLWLDVAARDWSDAALEATGLSRAAMPRLVEGSAPAGALIPELAARWGMERSPVLAGGAGDNAAGAVGLGAISPGTAFLSLGTSGVLWATTAGFAPNPASAVHAFCHAVPGLWHQMGVILSAASCLSWWAKVAGVAEADLLAPFATGPTEPGPVLFLPYLSGERTPHNDPEIRGVFAGLAHEGDRRQLTQAVLEGVAFAFKDCIEALAAAGTRIGSAHVIGGGSRSPVWIAILSSVLGIPLIRVAEGETGAALGAARLGRMAATGEAPQSVCRPPPALATVEPDARLHELYAERHGAYRALYRGLRGNI